MGELMPVPNDGGFVDFLRSYVNASNEERDQLMRELVKGQRSFKGDIETLKVDHTEIRGEVKAVRDELRGVRDLLKSVGLTTGQKKAIQKGAGQKVYAAAKADKQSIQQHYANLYGGLKDKYVVGSYWEIPREHYQEALGLIERYDGSSRHWWRE